MVLLKPLLLGLLVLALPLQDQEVKAQGMVPISDVIDHKVDNRKSSSKLSPDKVEAHKKIASLHQEEGGNLADRISRKDKPLELQNPVKHEAEDGHLLHFLLKRFPSADSAEEKVEILQNLENFAHKFENGRDLFQSTDALQSILLPSLNSTDMEIRKSACGVLAVASQNNEIVQQIATDAGVIRALVHLLSFDQTVKPKALFALTSLLRNFAKAQSVFIKDGGIPALVKVASYSETRKRSLNLIADLLSERRFCRIEQERRATAAIAAAMMDVEESSQAELPGVLNVGTDSFLPPTRLPPGDDPCDEFKVLETSLKESGWCDVLGDSIKNIHGFETYDQILTFEAVASSLPFCERNIFAQYSTTFRRILTKFEHDKDFSTEVEILKEILTVIDPGREEL